MSEFVTVPRAGYALVVARRGIAVTLWWGEAGDGQDVVATRAGRVITWASPDDCLAEASRDGWGVAHDEPTHMDLTPALEWHARHRRVLDVEAALNAWNLAGDVARSTSVPWDDRGVVADACHTKLTTACVPRLAGLDAYTPRWTTAEERYLRRRLAAAFTLLDRHLPAVRGHRPGAADDA